LHEALRSSSQRRRGATRCHPLHAVGGQLFAKIERGDIIIAAKLDRLFRSAFDALKVVESLKARGVKLHLLDHGGDIAGNGLSKLFLTIAAAFAEAERDRIRERIGQVKADQKARGRYLGGKVPFGFRRGDDGELVPYEAEQEAIREMSGLKVVQGKALRPIADAMRAKGHQISHEGVAGVLKSVITIICHSNGQFSSRQEHGRLQREHDVQDTGGGRRLRQAASGESWRPGEGEDYCARP
jgi:putative DNA-invertase from lambdoid prophage Rac